MNDRMRQLQMMKQSQGVYQDDEAGTIARGQIGNLKQSAISQGNNELFPEFSAKVKKVNQILGKIQANNDEIRDLKVKNQRAINSNNEKQINDDMNVVIKDNNNLNQQLKSTMEDLARDIQKDKHDSEADQGELQMKEKAFAALGEKIKLVLENSQDSQIEYKDGIKNKLSRQVKYLDNNITEQQIDEMVEDPQKYNELLQQKMGYGSIQLQNAVSDIQDKCRDIKRLQRNVEQVHQMFEDLAFLVQTQGAKIDQIEITVNKANRHVEKAEKNLRKAKDEHKAARKKMCCIIFFGIILLLVIVVPIAAS
ncbi:t-SNARE [Pseudocohnilembus persalinus]|uniref:t-SNARE n=1 Tax=Pseudocohnilembus persalinus TaxID=266149 RepID=A0A0V0QP57_PSEPJ|nr:t-SNARE [Pseudocohnilembus persalinus]|eukprot:KRX04127.1 t-SNARE [Pseudocohnilembus persalinus]